MDGSNAQEPHVNQNKTFYLVTFISTKACSKSQTNASQTNQQNQPQETLNDHAINTQSALLRVEWVPWDSRTHDRKQRDKCHVPNMGKTWKTIVESDGLWQETPATRSPKLMILDNSQEPSTLLWRTDAWITGFCKICESKQKCIAECPTRTFAVQQSWWWQRHHVSARPTWNKNLSQWKKHLALDNTKDPSKLKADTSTSQTIWYWRIVWTQTVSSRNHCTKQQIDKLRICWMLEKRRGEKVSIQQTKQCTICNCKSTLDAQISHVERTLNTSEWDWLGAKLYLHHVYSRIKCNWQLFDISHTWMNEHMSHIGTKTSWFPETLENRNVYNSTIFLPPSIVEHVNRIAKHLTIERLAHTFKHMPCHWINQKTLNNPSKTHMHGWLKRTRTILM